MKYTGYVGLKAKKRTRRKYFYFIFFILIIFFIYSYIQDKNSTKSSNAIKVEENLLYEDQSLQLKELKTKIFEYDQKLQLRNNLIQSLKDQIKNLEINNNELFESVKLQVIEEEEEESKNFKQTIQILRKEVREKNNKLLLFEENNIKSEEKNIKFNEQIQILNGRIDKLVLQRDEILFQKNKILSQKNDISKKIIDLQNNIIEKDKTIKNLKEKIHH